ncbi:MAG: hypothetical protein JNM93_11165 [Bacteriovoracaceae bacterium]|nr:hypothetical protein [Bacteriovoracaceae bacterium]
MNNLITDSSNKLYIITSYFEGKHYGMIASWICLASLMTEQVRFILCLSKFNHSAKAILITKKFILQAIRESDYEMAYIFGAKHSEEFDKFENINIRLHESGIKICNRDAKFMNVNVEQIMDTKDRYILYCVGSESGEDNEKFPPLTQEKFLNFLNEEQATVIKMKFSKDILKANSAFV